MQQELVQPLHLARYGTDLYQEGVSCSGYCRETVACDLLTVPNSP